MFQLSVKLQKGVKAAMAAIAARTSLENKHNLRKYDYFMILPSCLHSINKLTSTIQMDWWDSECCLGKYRECKIYSDCS